MIRGLSMLRAVPLLVIAAAAPLFSTALLQMTTEQMTTASTEIVRGTVTGAYTAMSGRTIFTHYRVQVAERFKGAASPTTDVAVPGGAYQSVRQSFAGVPVLRTGQEYMLFLWQGATGPNQPVGLNQGILEVRAGSGGSAMASRPAAGEMMLNAAHRPVVDHAVQIRLSDLHAVIRATLAKPNTAGVTR